MNSFVSIVMPVKDTPFSELGRSINSLLGQTHQNFEIIIVDDNSTRKETVNSLKEYERKDSRIRILKNPGSGIVDALNFGISRTQSSLVARMDSDDEALPCRLEKQLDAFEKSPDVALVGSNMKIFERANSNAKDSITVRTTSFPTQNEDIRERLQTVSNFFCISHPTVMFKKEAILSVGGYTKGFNRAEDLLLWVKLILKGHKLINSSSVLLNYYQLNETTCSVSRPERYLNTAIIINCLKFKKTCILSKDINPNIALGRFTDSEKAKVLSDYLILLQGIHKNDLGKEIRESLNKFPIKLNESRVSEIIFEIRKPTNYRAAPPYEFQERVIEELLQYSLF